MHAKGESDSRWGDLWLVDGRPIRRESRYVWGATGDRDATVVTMSGVFHKIGKEGLPEAGFSTSLAELQAQLAHRTELARGADKAAKEWLQDNVGWWRFEEWAHEALYMDITESVVVMAQTWDDTPDESRRDDACTACHERRPLVLADEFCSEECMEEYVKTFGMV